MVMLCLMRLWTLLHQKIGCPLLETIAHKVAFYEQALEQLRVTP